MSESRVCAILLAGGLGSRMKLNSTKQTLLILGQSVLKRTLLAFENCDEITDIVLVTREEEYAFATSESSDIKKVRKIVFGGKTRSESAKNGFLSIDFPCDFVAVHDVARCMIFPDMITKVIKNAEWPSVPTDRPPRTANNIRTENGV